MDTEPVFRALADPGRRLLLDRLFERDAQSLLYNPSPIVLAALLYLVMLWPLTRLLARLEQGRVTATGPV